MAYDLSSTWCSGVSYGVTGYTWAVHDYLAFSVGCDAGIADPSNGVWVTVPYATFLQILTDAQNGSSSGGSSSASAGFTPLQISQLQYLADNPPAMNLSIPDGALIGASVLAVWAIAAAFKAVANSIKDAGESE